MDPNVIAAIVGVAAVLFTVIGGVWYLGNQINALGGEIKALNARVDGLQGEFNARMDGFNTRLGNLEKEVHAINEHFRNRQ